MEKYDDYKIPSKENMENLRHEYSNMKVNALKNDASNQNDSFASTENTNNASNSVDKNVDLPSTSPISNPSVPIAPVTATKPIKFNLFLMYAMLSLLSGYTCNR